MCFKATDEFTQLHKLLEDIDAVKEKLKDHLIELRIEHNMPELTYTTVQGSQVP